jgi:peptidyl-prolyl cis-trans isomerase D
MSAMLRSSGKSVTVWILLAMIILGLGGYKVSSFSGRTQSIGAVGESEITVKEYAQALRQEMNAAAQQFGHPLSMAEARGVGLDRAVQGRLFGAAARSEQARKLALSVGDAAVSQQIRAARPFQGVDGKFDRETYRAALRQQGLTEVDFETRLRADIARSILQGAVAGGVDGPAELVTAYAAYLGETRDISSLEIPDAAVEAGLGSASAAALKGWYDAHLPEFTKPEAREISYVWLTPEMLKDKVTVDPEALQAAYEDHRADYVQPERRKLSRLVFPNAAEAEAGKAKIAAGSTTLAALAAERGLSAADIGLGEVTRDDIGGAAGEAVFASAAPGLIGPVETDLGAALFDVERSVPGEETRFDEAKPDLVAQVSMERARRMISDKTSELEDRLASGATLEDMVKDGGMTLGHIAMSADTKEGIAAYQSFRDAAAKVTAEDFPELVTLEDGGVFAVRLDGITAAAPIPFEQVQDKVEASWRVAQLIALKQARAKTIADAVAAGQGLGAQAQAAGLVARDTAALQRGGFVEGAPAGLSATAFGTDPGKAAVVSDGAAVFVVETRAVHAPDLTTPGAKQLQSTFTSRIGQLLGADLVDFYARAAQTEAGIKLDSAAINAVQAQIQ